MKKILVVDDTEFMRLTIRRILEEAGYNVIAEAENGAVAIEQFKLHQPDLILMDITMPVMNGLEALKQIKTIDPNSTIVIVSALGQEMIVREAIASGAKSFIVKPFQAERLIELIERIL